MSRDDELDLDEVIPPEDDMDEFLAQELAEIEAEAKGEVLDLDAPIPPAPKLSLYKPGQKIWAYGRVYVIIDSTPDYYVVENYNGRGSRYRIKPDCIEREATWDDVALKKRKKKSKEPKMSAEERKAKIAILVTAKAYDIIEINYGGVVEEVEFVDFLPTATKNCLRAYRPGHLGVFRFPLQCVVRNITAGEKKDPEIKPDPQKSSHDPTISATFNAEKRRNIQKQ